MSEYLTVEVTAADIRSGARGYCRNCPIALAAKRVTGETAYVGNTGVEIEGGAWKLYRLSTRADRFVRAFDELGPRAVKPARFRFRRLA